VVKKILSFFYTDLQWKLISLVLAAGVWLLAMNMHDPMVNNTYSVPLRLISEEVLERDGLVVLNRNELLDTQINIQVRSLRSVYDALTQEGRVDIYPFIDLRAVVSSIAQNSDEPDTQVLPVIANLQPGLDLVFVRSASVDVLLDTLVVRSFPVEIGYVGQVADGYELRSIQAVNPNVTVRGARTHVNRVDSIRLEADLTNAGSGVTSADDVPLVVFDRYGEDITDYVSLSVVETSVRVQILPVRALDIRIAPVGQLAPGFALAEIVPSDLFVDVVGVAEVLDETEYILLEFDLDGLIEDTSQQLIIADFLPDGIELSRNAPEEITADAVIEPIMRRTFSMPRGSIRTLGFGGLFSPVDDTIMHVRVVVSGPQSRVSAMTLNDIVIEMDMNYLAIGTHWVPLTAFLPLGVVLAEPLQAMHMQVHEPTEREPTPPVGPETTPMPPTPTPPPYEYGNGENGGEDYPPGYPPDPDNGEAYPPDDDDDPYNGYYYEGD